MRTQRGNILFLILLAVVLFAALSYAVTSSMRGGGNNADKESVQAAVADISNFLSAVKTATDRMMMTGGLRADQISYTHPYKQYNSTYIPGQDDNANCTNDACRVFKPSGGGVEARSFESYAVPNPVSITAANTMPGHINILVFDFPYAGTSANDIVLQLNFVKPSVCDALDASGLSVSVPLQGTWLRGNDPAQWNSAGWSVQGSTSGVLGKSVITTRRWSGGVVDNCDIIQLLIAR